MLYYNTINPDLHNYLSRLMQSNVFNDFYLVGGIILQINYLTIQIYNLKTQ